jgi:hypothetical protein
MAGSEDRGVRDNRRLCQLGDRRSGGASRNGRGRVGERQTDSRIHDSQRGGRYVMREANGILSIDGRGSGEYARRGREAGCRCGREHRLRREQQCEFQEELLEKHRMSWRRRQMAIDTLGVVAGAGRGDIGSRLGHAFRVTLGHTLRHTFALRYCFITYARATTYSRREVEAGSTRRGESEDRRLPLDLFSNGSQDCRPVEERELLDPA